VRLLNYQSIDAAQMHFDKIVSVGMFEHVGQDNLSVYMDKVQELLSPGGMFLLHNITGLFETTANSWIGKYIFPGGYVTCGDVPFLSTSCYHTTRYSGGSLNLANG
jgi:cyclopropane-fatty-acyl-phospholipid synthase